MDKNTVALSKIDILNSKCINLLVGLSTKSGVNVEDISLDDNETLSVFRNGETSNIPHFSSDFARNVLKICNSHIKDFEDLVKIFGFCHGTNVWSDNAECLISSDMELKNIIGTTNDIVDFLLRYGVDTFVAQRIMEMTRRGLATRKPEARDYINSLELEYNIPYWWIESVCKIGYVFKSDRAIECTKFAFKITYFKVHYPKIFNEVYEKVYAD